MGVIHLEVPDVAAAIRVLKPLLERKKLSLDGSIIETTTMLRAFEESKGMSSKDFFEKFEEGLVGNDCETMLWVIEYKAHRFLEKERIIVERMLESCR